MHAREKEQEREREKKKRERTREREAGPGRESRAARKNAQACRSRADLPRAVAVLQPDRHTQKKENPSRPQEKKGGRRRRKTRAEEKGGTRKKHPETPATQKPCVSLSPRRTKTVRLANRNTPRSYTRTKSEFTPQNPPDTKPKKSGTLK